MDDIINFESQLIRANSTDLQELLDLFHAVKLKMRAATFILDTRQDVDYLDVTWQYEGDSIYVLHKVAVHPDFQGLGLGKKMTLSAIQKARNEGGDAFRLDTYSLNPTSVRLYQSLGFDQADGYCYFHGHEAPFYCFEMKL